jgi:hypothetical protein
MNRRTAARHGGRQRRPLRCSVPPLFIRFLRTLRYLPLCNVTVSQLYNSRVSRLWRLRKRQEYVDAELSDEGNAGARIQFFYNGELAYQRLWPTLALAVAEADSKRAELERGGWIEHW